MNEQPLQTVEVETGPAPTAAVIWLHGFGADGHDFEPMVPRLVRPGERALRFIFPHAPVRAITLNGGAQARAWFDILGLDRLAVQDESGVRASYAAIRALIRREQERGVPTARVVLAGFSQGAALAMFTGTRLPERLAGIIGLSGYQLLGSSFASERAPANQATPILMAHGEFDPVIDMRAAEFTRHALETAGYSVEWHRYKMGHEICPEEVGVIAAFLNRVLSSAPSA